MPLQIITLLKAIANRNTMSRPKPRITIIRHGISRATKPRITVDTSSGYHPMQSYRLQKYHLSTKAPNHNH
jgi:hypothetical protein